MKMSDRGLAALAGHEGIVLSPYKDSVGVWTIGVGHTAAAGAPHPQSTPSMTIAEAMDLFRRDVARYEADVDRAVTVPLQQHEFDALVSFHYNTGGIARANLTKALNRGDRSGAIDGFMGWLQPPEIAGRRTAEQKLFATGAYGDGKATVYTASAGRVNWSSGKRVDVLAMLGADVSPTVEEPTSSAANHQTTARLNMRAAAPDGTVILTLPQGQPVEILGTWHLVRAVVDGRIVEGWASGAYIVEGSKP